MAEVLEDVKAGKGWIIGVITFTGAVAGLCTALFNWDVSKVSAVSLVAVSVVLGLSFVIQRSENRNSKRLELHISEVNERAEQTNNTLSEIKEMLLESRRSTLRIEMKNEIARHPENHDTILKMAEEYFYVLKSNWIMWDAFCRWMDSEEQNGRKVYVPKVLLDVMEKKGMDKD